ncbi:hypothetical protein [Hyphomicrobium sp. MC1]|uniref:hypothetical protein n=1 Tax=Hyphomicrobium sp. (strain MC1) TaxID=717785 RepID=UPI000213E90E|nr:hypothetical protein [Hyphomicrobium sp. MC1]CCB66570.1 protein of unknown function [Hyphomicrobium sp. MC1]
MPKKACAAEEGYEVFARRNSSETLHHLGRVLAGSDDLARARAWYVFDEHPWKEMWVVRSNAIVEVLAVGRGANAERIL